MESWNVPPYHLHSFFPSSLPLPFLFSIPARPHFGTFFGADIKVRMGADGVTSAVVWDLSTASATTTHGRNEDGAAADEKTAVAHAAVLYSRIPADRRPSILRPTSVGLLGHVITHPDHRRQGHGGTVVTSALDAFDAEHPSSLLVLGTGSPYAAKTYQKHGFVHLAGGLDGGVKGYNPEDAGEWIMIRSRSLKGSASFNAADYFAESATEDPADYVVEPLAQYHWAELVLLLNAFEVQEVGGKLPAAGIGDGLDAEEKVLQLISQIASNDSGSGGGAGTACSAGSGSSSSAGDASSGGSGGGGGSGSSSAGGGGGGGPASIAIASRSFVARHRDCGKVHGLIVTTRMHGAPAAEPAATEGRGGVYTVPGAVGAERALKKYH